MKRKYLATATCIAATLGLSSCQQAKEHQHTNFIIIFMDDMGWGDISSQGATGFHTPNMDRLANEGMRFTNFYVAQAVSSASRAALLTGTYPNRIGFAHALTHRSRVGIADEETTIAEMLREIGYTSAVFGKWHLGHHPQFLPTNHGFDEFLGIPYSNDMWPYHPQVPGYFPDLPMIEGLEIVNPAMTAEDQEQMTRLFTERAVNFITKNRDNPFFVLLAHPMPHVPLFVSDKFRGKSEHGLFGDVMMEIDWSVGEIMNTVDKLGLGENTMIIVSSDNGPWIRYGNHAGSTGGLREAKGGIFEGGMRVPGLFRWTGTIPAGSINNQLATTMDLLPTFAYISGAPLPPLPIDGYNIICLLTNAHATSSPRQYLLYYFGMNNGVSNLRGIRNSRFKLVLPHYGRSYEGFLPGLDGFPGPQNPARFFEKELFDLFRDPGERNNVIELFPEVVEELMEIVERAREDLGDALTGRPGTNLRPIGQLRE
jgi:arylsulfatase